MTFPETSAVARVSVRGATIPGTGFWAGNVLGFDGEGFHGLEDHVGGGFFGFGLEEEEGTLTPMPAPRTMAPMVNFPSEGTVEYDP